MKPIIVNKSEQYPDGSMGIGVVDEDSILNAYPLTNIK